MGLDKTSVGYQEEVVIKLLRDLRDNLANNGNDGNGGNNGNDDNDDIYRDNDRIKNLEDKILDLETKLKNNKVSIEEKDKLYKKLQEYSYGLEDVIETYDDTVKEDKNKIYMSNKFKSNMENNMNNLYEKASDILNNSNDTLNKIDNFFKIKKVLNEKKYIVKNDEVLTNAERNKLQNEIKNLDEKLKEIEKDKESIHKTNIQITNQLKKLMNERKEFKLTSDAERSKNEIKRLEEELKKANQKINVMDNLDDILNKFFQSDKEKSYDPNGFDKKWYSQRYW